MSQTCRARQVNDQMICPCGKQWDVNDPEPPECGGYVAQDARLPGRATRRRAAYLGFINRLFGVKPE